MVRCLGAPILRGPRPDLAAPLLDAGRDEIIHQEQRHKTIEADRIGRPQPLGQHTLAAHEEGCCPHPGHNTGIRQSRTKLQIMLMLTVSHKGTVPKTDPAHHDGHGIHQRQPDNPDRGYGVQYDRLSLGHPDQKPG